MTDTYLDTLRERAQVERRREVIDCLTAAGGKVSLAAKLLEASRREKHGDHAEPCSRQTFYRLMDAHGISRPRRDVTRSAAK